MIYIFLWRIFYKNNFGDLATIGNLAILRWVLKKSSIVESAMVARSQNIILCKFIYKNQIRVINIRFYLIFVDFSYHFVGLFHKNNFVDLSTIADLATLIFFKNPPQF